MYTQQQLADAYEKDASPLLTEYGNYAKGFHAGHYLQNFAQTAEELDNLPAGSVIVTEEGGIYYATDVTVVGEVIESKRAWEEVGFEAYRSSDDIALPARIIGNASDEWKI